MTNGLGGYACGTIAGAATRRYHAFLMASLEPPVKRTLLVSKVDVSVLYLGRLHHLSADEFADRTVEPRGFVNLESFDVIDGIPVWRFCVADALLEQRIFMAPGANTSYLSLEVLRAGSAMRIVLKPLVTCRDFHSQERGSRPFNALAAARSCVVQPPGGGRPFRLALDAGDYAAGDTWYWNFLHREEAARGLDALEDLWLPGTFAADARPGQRLYFTATADEPAPPRGDAVRAVLIARSQRLMAAVPATAPPWVRSLATASDQFIVRRAAGASVIAGYPWFADWGRDTMIALPGLTTVLGRLDTAASILRTYASFLDRGMLPNRFPDAGEAPQYNTADATLWFVQALGEQMDAKHDPDLLRDLMPALIAVIHAHADGTRYGIQVDAGDGLLRAGEAGLQLTWMDAKQGERVFTPRIGKPVEINALWLNALDIVGRLAGRVGNDGEMQYCRALLERAGQGFERFWNAQRGCLYDVLDADGGTSPDATVRPNQIFAVSLPYCTLPAERMRAVVDTCARELVTSYGLRTLSPEDPSYVGRYSGNPWQRDAAYHQGTAWAWLLGPFACAHFRVYGDARRAQAYLEPIAQHLDAACLGSVSEIFDGHAPHAARGCFAQAWSVAEILRSWIFLERQHSNSSGQGSS